ncbi:MAG: hypothetical protein NT062_14395 [Proteobacteria bacterium]|nr:hypothetical protein [Pseudomonadota bacterium]
MSRYLCVASVALAFVGCGSKSSDSSKSAPPPEVTGLAAVPSSAEAVIGVDVGKLLDAPLVARVVDQLFLRDATLAARWEDVKSQCKLDLGKNVKRVMLALGPNQTTPGTGPVLLVATGTFVEADLAACMRTIVGKGGGTLTAKPLDNRTLYTAKDGNRVLVFAFGRPDTLVLGSNEAYVTESLAAKGQKLSDNPDMKAWLALVDQNAPIWGVGRVDPRVSGGLVKYVSGLVAGPRAIAGTLDPAGGAKVAASIVMASKADANTLESFTKTQIGQIAAAAQLVKLGGVVNKIETKVANDIVGLSVALSVEDLNQLLSALDGGAPPPQDAQPSP